MPSLRARPRRQPQRPARAPILSVHLAGAGGAIVLPARQDLIQGLTDCLFGWPATLSPTLPPPEQTLAVVAAEQGGTFRLGARALDGPLSGLSTTAAVCALIADLALGFCESLPGGMGLHCGAVRLGQGPLLLLAGPRRAGKSTLIARLAREETAKIFCDDVLPITAQGDALALGLAPRIRLPAAPALGHVTPLLADDRYAYLRPRNPAAHGTRARPKVLVALDRRPGSGAPRLHQLPPDAAIRLILQQTLTLADTPAAALAQAEALLHGMTCVTLRYDALEPATALLGAAFGGTTALPPDLLPPLPSAALASGANLPLDLPLQRHPEVHLRHFGQSLFLWHPDTPMLWHLNPLAQAIWALLETDQTTSSLVGLLCEAFPHIPPDQIATDVAAFLGAAQDSGLVTSPCR